MTDADGGPCVCNICGATEWIDMNNRVGVRCADCKSVERTRMLKLVLDRFFPPQPGWRVLHLAPEPGLANWLRETVGEGYEAADIAPEKYAFARARKLDLLDAHELPDSHYDLIVHCHVMEHIPGNWSVVMQHLHRSLTPNGAQVCCIPIFRKRYYEEDLSPISEADAVKRFGQNDHVRRFGALDLDRTLGALFRLPEEYDMASVFGKPLLKRHNIPVKSAIGWNVDSALVLRKDDLRLPLPPPPPEPEPEPLPEPKRRAWWPFASSGASAGG